MPNNKNSVSRRRPRRDDKQNAVIATYATTHALRNPAIECACTSDAFFVFEHLAIGRLGRSLGKWLDSWAKHARRSMERQANFSPFEHG
jgi:hypothetical protein